MMMICQGKKKVERTDGDDGGCRILQHGALSGSLESSGLLAGNESWGQGWRNQAGPTVGEGTIR